MFHPYFTEITTSISIQLQQSNNVTSKLLKNFSKSIFFGNFKLPLGIFQNKFEFWFLVNLHHSIEHYEVWKKKNLFETKLRCSFTKNVQFHFCLVFWAILWFYQQFRCKIYVWWWCDSKLIFVLVISNKEKSFCQGKFTILQMQITILLVKIEKSISCISIFLLAQITILFVQIEKSLFCINIFLPRQKNLNCKGCICCEKCLQHSRYKDKLILNNRK